MDVVRPTNLAELLKELQLNSATGILAGGTDFLVNWKGNRINPSTVQSIFDLDELKALVVENGQLIIGAMVTHQELAQSPMVKKYAGVLAEACSLVGSTQIRNRGTIGGNLVTASPAGDSIPALWVLGARLTLRSSSSERKVAVQDFITGPGKTVLKPGEVLTQITIPLPDPAAVSFYKKLGLRQALAISIVSVAVKIKTVADTIETINIACGSVGPTVMELKNTSRSLAGCSLEPVEIWKRVAEAGMETSPISDLRASAQYRQKMVGALLYEGLYELYSQRINS